MKPYNHLPGYLHRWTILKFKSLHFRIHYVLSEDKTPFLHNHPFFYLSIILSGGYSELLQKENRLVLKKYNRFSFLFRKDSDYHRIVFVQPNTKTLFLTWKSNFPWNLKSHPDIPQPIDYWNPVDGLYFNSLTREFRLRKNSIWLIKSCDKNLALSQIKPSIHQCLDFNHWSLIDSLNIMNNNHHTTIN